jgi:hypothetical protein
MELIESIPVEERIRSIEALQGLSLRRLIPELITTEYFEYLVSLMFIDIRVYRGLAYFDSQEVSQVLPTSNNTSSRAFRTRILITLHLIVLWTGIVSAIGNAQMQVFMPNDPVEHARILDPNSTGPLLLQLSLAGWIDRILPSRPQRLRNTGYEF